MADPTPQAPTDQTGALDAGHTTSEYAQTKIVVVLTSIIAALSTITEVLGKAQALFPEAPKGIGLWIALAFAGVGALTSIAYTVQRTEIKVAALKAGTAAPAAPAAGPAGAAARIGA